MTSVEILEWLEAELRNYPSGSTGNEREEFVMGVAASAAETDRAAFVAAMREWLGRPDGNRPLLAAIMAARCHLFELEPDLKQLLEAVRAGKALWPAYEEMLLPHLKLLGRH